MDSSPAAGELGHESWSREGALSNGLEITIKNQIVIDGYEYFSPLRKNIKKNSFFPLLFRQGGIIFY
jgi:hypothetical protein